MIEFSEGLPDKARLIRLFDKLDNLKSGRPDLNLKYKVEFGSFPARSTVSITSTKEVFHIEMYEEGLFVIGRMIGHEISAQDDAVCINLAFQTIAKELNRETRSADGSLTP